VSCFDCRALRGGFGSRASASAMRDFVISAIRSLKFGRGVDRATDAVAHLQEGSEALVRGRLTCAADALIADGVK
jgi:hypothetical protein